MGKIDGTASFSKTTTGSSAPHGIAKTSFGAPQKTKRLESGIDGLPPRSRIPSPSRMRVLQGGVCSSQPRTLEGPNEITGLARDWQAHRKASFHQSVELAQIGSQSNESGACVAFSALWCRQIAARPSQDAQSRMASMKEMTTQASQMQSEHQDRMDAADYSTGIHPFDASIRQMGLNLDWGQRMRVDVLDDEESALGALARNLSQEGLAHVIILGRTPDCPASGHVVAARAANNRVVLFDPNLGEFKCNPSQVPTVLRAMIANSSMRYPVPEVETIPVRS